MNKSKRKKRPDPEKAMQAACRAMTAWHDSVLTTEEKVAKVEKRFGWVMAQAYVKLVEALGKFRK
jgi:phage-related minor tail protein